MKKENYSTLEEDNKPKNSGNNSSADIEKGETTGVAVNEKMGFVNSVKKFFNQKKELTAPDASKPATPSDFTTVRENIGCRQKTMEYLIQKVEIEQSYSAFMILVAIGGGLMCLSFLFIPLIIIAPQKFVNLFSMGSFLIMMSFIFIYGTKKYFEILFSPTRFHFTILFIVFTLIGVYFSIFGGHWLISLICTIFQFITLIVFGLSFVPGGGVGINLIGNMMLAPIRGLWERITG